jgi:hypothetical protein
VSEKRKFPMLDKVIIGLITSLIGWFMVASGLFLWNMTDMMPIAFFIIVIGFVINCLAFVIWNGERI